jgi:hypothetical protein
VLGHGPLGSAPLGSAPLPLWFQANFAKQRQKPDEDRIYAAFGRFIASYALAEGGVHIAARFFSGMPDDKARIVFNGLRLVDVVIRLRQFVATTDHAEEIERLIAQLNLIGGARNQFAHRLIEYEHGRGLIVTNRLICNSTDNARPKLFRVPHRGSVNPPALAGWDSAYNMGCRASRVAAIPYGTASIILYGLRNIDFRCSLCRAATLRTTCGRGISRIRSPRRPTTISRLCSSRPKGST